MTVEAEPSSTSSSALLPCDRGQQGAVGHASVTLRPWTFIDACVSAVAAILRDAIRSTRAYRRIATRELWTEPHVGPALRLTSVCSGRANEEGALLWGAGSPRKADSHLEGKQLSLRTASWMAAGSVTSILGAIPVRAAATTVKT
jgi:hypothetical protein